MADPGAPSRLPKQQFGNYELLAPLAVGGTAEIFLARMTGAAGFEKIVVVKQLLEHLAEDEEFVDMFLDEARLGSHLHHSNIVQVLDLGQVDGRYFIAMEYIAGMTVAVMAAKAQMRVEGGLPIPLTVAMMHQACIGLHHAHEARLPDGTPLKIVHRDVSPQNLIVTFGGDLKIVDFGIAHAAVRDAKTKAGMIKGKFAYMSPEQCLGKPLDRRTDIFALGTVLWECVTGQRLFKKKTTYETYQTIISGKVLPPRQVNPAIDPDLEAVIMRALAYRAEDRWETAEAMGEALAAYLQRGSKRITSLDVAKFVERHFTPEIEEHRQRLSQLMSGRPRPLSSEDSWDGDLLEDAAMTDVPEHKKKEPQDWASSAGDTLDTNPQVGAELGVARGQPRAIEQVAPVLPEMARRNLPLPAPERTAVAVPMPSAPMPPPTMRPLAPEHLDPADVTPLMAPIEGSKSGPIPRPIVDGPRERTGPRRLRRARPRPKSRHLALWIGIVVLLLVTGCAFAIIMHQLGYHVPVLAPLLETWFP